MGAAPAARSATWSRCRSSRSRSWCWSRCPGVSGRVYEQYVQYHTDAVAGRPIAANLHKLVSTFVERDLPLLVAGVVTALVVLMLVLRRRRAGTDTDARSVRTRRRPCPVVSGRGLARARAGRGAHRVTHVAEPRGPRDRADRAPRRHRSGRPALGRALRRRRRRAWRCSPRRGPSCTSASCCARRRPPGTRRCSSIGSATCPRAHSSSVTPRAWSGAPVAGSRTATSTCRSCASRRRPRRLRLTGDDIVRDAGRADVCAVVRWSKKRFTHFPGLGRRLRAEGYRPELRRPHSPEVLWRKVTCRPHDGRAGRTSAAVAPARSPS